MPVDKVLVIVETHNRWTDLKGNAPADRDLKLPHNQFQFRQARKAISAKIDAVEHAFACWVVDSWNDLWALRRKRSNSQWLVITRKLLGDYLMRKTKLRNAALWAGAMALAAFVTGSTGWIVSAGQAQEVPKCNQDTFGQVACFSIKLCECIYDRGCVDGLWSCVAAG